MRYLWIMLCFFSIGSLKANGLPNFKPGNIQAYEGVILSIQEFKFINRPAPHTQLLLQTAKGDQIVVEVGPSWYLHTEGVSLAPHERITVSGSLSESDGKPTLTASSLTKNGTSTLLRSPDGTPRWQ